MILHSRRMRMRFENFRSKQSRSSSRSSGNRDHLSFAPFLCLSLVCRPSIPLYSNINRFIVIGSGVVVFFYGKCSFINARFSYRMPNCIELKREVLKWTHTYTNAAMLCEQDRMDGHRTMLSWIKQIRWGDWENCSVRSPRTDANECVAVLFVVFNMFWNVRCVCRWLASTHRDIDIFRMRGE